MNSYTVLHKFMHAWRSNARQEPISDSLST